ncbi:MAG: hypothetical protein AAGF84_08650 [Planctomycetota bacterium]
MPGFVPILFGGFVLFMIVTAIFGHRQTKKRREALGAWATSLGLKFRDGQDPTFDERFSFAALRQGRNRYAFNRAEGVFDGRTVWAFDYHYETESTRTTTDAKGNTRTEKTTQHHYFSAVIVRANVPLEKLLIRPEGFGDKFKAFFGSNDLDFESGDFSRRYHVLADERRYAYDVLHARAIDFLLTRPKCTIEFDDTDHVLILRGVGRLPPEGLQESLETVDTLLDLMPDYLKQQQHDRHAPLESA